MHVCTHVSVYVCACVLCACVCAYVHACVHVWHECVHASSLFAVSAPSFSFRMNGALLSRFDLVCIYY